MGRRAGLIRCVWLGMCKLGCRLRGLMLRYLSSRPNILMIRVLLDAYRLSLLRKLMRLLLLLLRQLMLDWLRLRGLLCLLLDLWACWHRLTWSSRLGLAGLHGLARYSRLSRWPRGLWFLLRGLIRSLLRLRLLQRLLRLTLLLWLLMWWLWLL